MKGGVSTGFRWRIAIFVVTLVLVAGLIGYAEHAAWRQGRFALEKQRTSNPERYNLAGIIQAKLVEMSESFKQYRQGGKPADSYRFKDNEAKVREIISTNQEALTPAENALLQEIGSEFEMYVSNVTGLLKRRTLDASGTISEEVQQLIENGPVKTLELCRKFEATQEQAFATFMGESDRRAVELRRMLVAWSLLMPAGGVLLVGLVYKRTVGPLRSKLEESKAMLERHEKLASLGVFAAGVAHEIRNPLMAMKVHLFSLGKHFAPGSPEQEKTAILGGEVNRLEKIVKDFLQFARPSDPVVKELVVEELLGEVAGLVKPKCEQMKVELRVKKEGPLWVSADQGQLKQVLLNLVNNALESMEGSQGVITLGAWKSKEGLQGRPRPVVILEVTDTGRGIPMEVQKRLFDPFFTTKTEGTGLGLSIAMRIIEKHGGTIRYGTQAGRGTSFQVILPQSTVDEKPA